MIKIFIILLWDNNENILSVVTSKRPTRRYFYARGCHAPGIMLRAARLFFNIPDGGAKWQMK